MAKQPRSLHGKVVAITGGARGIGRATAQALARKGARVAIGDVDRELAEAAAAEIGAGTIALGLDVTDRDSFAAFLDQVEQHLGPLDVLVNNAGIMPIGRFADESDATAQRIIDINVHGVIHGIKLALARMQPRGRGHIVNLASQAGKAGLPGGATYCASKHAVIGLSEAVYGEVRDGGIDISIVMPNVVNTELGSGLGNGPAVRVVEPEDVADAIVAELEQPRFEVWIPRSSGIVYRLVLPLPRRVRGALGRLLGADKVLANADRAARMSYEQRAARSDPGLEPEATREGELASAGRRPG